MSAKYLSHHRVMVLSEYELLLHCTESAMRIIGHRGARGEAPENTLGGFQYLRDLGVCAVEFDVRQLKDHSLVVIHDDHLLRTSGQDQALYACNRDDLAQYNHAVKWSQWHRAEPTPMLYDTLKIIEHFDHIEVEVKPLADLAAAEQLTKDLQQQLQGFEDRAIITSFDRKVHQSLQQQQCRFKRGLLIEDDIQYQAIEQAIQLGCEHIGWMDQLSTPEMIHASQQAGLSISVWTVNDVQRAKALRDLGIQGLITDYPKMMLAQL